MQNGWGSGLRVVLSIVFVGAILVGCGGGARTATTPQAAPSNAPPMPSGEQGPPVLAESHIVCPTENEHARQLYSEAHTLASQGDLAASSEKYKAAIELDPTFCDAMDNLAVQYRRSGRVEEAIALYQRSVEVAPHNEMAWQNLGLAYQKVERNEDALRAYDRLIAISPENPEGWYGTGYVLLFAGRLTEARPALRQAAALYQKQSSPLRDDALMMLGLVAAGLGDWAEARAQLEAVYATAGRLGLTNAFLGEAYLQPDSLDRAKARTFLERAKSQGVDVPPELWQRAAEPASSPPKR